MEFSQFLSVISSSISHTLSLEFWFATSLNSSCFTLGWLHHHLFLKRKKSRSPLFPVYWLVYIMLFKVTFSVLPQIFFFPDSVNMFFLKKNFFTSPVFPDLCSNFLLSSWQQFGSLSICPLSGDVLPFCAEGAGKLLHISDVSNLSSILLTPHTVAFSSL